jgi:AraC-like DNA-binding protein
MPDSHSHVRTVFRSSLVRVLDYRCAGHADAREEIPQGFEIVLPRAGAYQRRDVHGTFLADPNQVLFFNMGEPYDITHPIPGRDSSTVLLFAPSLLIEMLRAYNPDVENRPDRLFQRSHFTFNSRLQTLQYRLLRAGMIDPLSIEEEIINLTDEILCASHSRRAVQEKPSRDTLRAHVEQTHLVRTFLNVHIGSPLQLDHISSAVHLSPYHLCRVFKQNTGMTLHHYIKRLRLFNAAERLLENPGMRLDLLALEFGFSNHGNFSTVFRQTFGINPSELRRAHPRQMSKNLKA